MTREEAKRRAELYSALAEGKTIQVQNPNGGEWFDVKIDTLRSISEELNYRIKPEPFYRPFYSQEECVKEMMNHTPFGIITDGISILKAAIYPNGIHVVGLSVLFHIMPFSKALESIMFSDGKEFGIKVQP